jgi:DNA-binding LacI/PurR family transcriptional regulator
MSGVGLVVNGDLLTDDRYVSGVVHALGDRLTEAGTRLIVRVADSAESESDIYHFWHASGGPDAVALIGATNDDPRVRLLRRLGTPFAVVADRSRVHDFSAVIVDNIAMVDEIRRFLALKGYARAMYVTGFEESDAGGIRAAAFDDGKDDVVEIVRSERGVAATVRAAVAALRDDISAVIFDTDAAAVAALDAFREINKRVPEDVAVLSWTDSLLCQSSEPPITALNQRASETGSLLAECVLRTLETSGPVVLNAPPPTVVQRESA